MDRGAGTLQPSTMITYLRTLFGHMRDVYDWRYNLDRDFHLKSGLWPHLDKLNGDRKDDIGKSYGTGTQKSKFKKMEKVGQLKWDVFDEDNPVQHTMKVMEQCESYFGFSRNAEHTLLRVENPPLPLLVSTLSQSKALIQLN